MTIPTVIAVAFSAALVALAFVPTDPLVLIAAVGVLVTTIGAVIVNVIVALRTSAKVDTSLAATAVNSQKIDDVNAKADVITGHVNSAAAAAAAKIDALEKQIVTLTATLAKSDQTAAVRAQSDAIARAGTAEDRKPVP